MSKKIDRLKEAASLALFKAWETIEDLNYEIDYGPELHEQEEGELIQLGHVMQLMEVVYDLFPYHKED